MPLSQANAGSSSVPAPAYVHTYPAAPVHAPPPRPAVPPPIKVRSTSPELSFDGNKDELPFKTPLREPVVSSPVVIMARRILSEEKLAFQPPPSTAASTFPTSPRASAHREEAAARLPPSLLDVMHRFAPDPQESAYRVPGKVSGTVPLSRTAHALEPRTIFDVLAFEPGADLMSAAEEERVVNLFSRKVLEHTANPEAWN